LNHVLYSDGNTEKITWVIQTNDSKISQKRTHVDLYRDKVTTLQSRYISLHIGLFWGIGIFLIKNGDTVKIKLDEKIMFDQITSNLEINDKLIGKRIQFIKQLVNQRKIKIQFELIDRRENLAKENI